MKVMKVTVFFFFGGVVIRSSRSRWYNSQTLEGKTRAVEKTLLQPGGKLGFGGLICGHVFGRVTLLAEVYQEPLHGKTRAESELPAVSKDEVQIFEAIWSSSNPQEMGACDHYPIGDIR